MSRNSRLLGGCSLPAIMLVISTAAQAADVAPVAAHDWNGLYVGGFLGYGDIESNGFFATSLDLGFGGGSSMAGGRVGWNWQFGSLLFGIENDFSFFNFQDENIREETYAASADFLGTLRGRVGWADDNVLFYATGGAAFLHADVQTSLNFLDDNQIGNEDSKDLSTYGAVVGAGLEWALTPNVSFVTEGLWFFFDQKKSLANLEEGLGPGPNPDGVPEGVPGNFFEIGDAFAFRVGINWKLWDPAKPDQGFWPLHASVIENATDYDWSGFYVGPHVGIGQIDKSGQYLRDRMTNPPPAIPPDPSHPAPVQAHDFRNQGVLEGLQVGYNWQIGSLVYGIEADVTGLDWDDLITDLKRPTEPQSARLDINLLASARLRAGYAFGSLMGYATGGLAYLNADFEDVNHSDETDVSGLGAVVGGGIEWGYRPDLSFKAEGLVLVFNTHSDLTDLRNSDPGDNLDLENGLVLQLGANWRPGADSTASYGASSYEGGPYSWGGLYAGAHVGFGGPVMEGMYNPDPLPNESLDLTNISALGALGGGQAGFNWQWGSLVFGVEGDVAATDWDGSDSKFWIPKDKATFNSDILATVRGRAGYADDNLLFYITAGLAYLDADLTLREDGQTTGTKDLATLGGAAGVGMEWGITEALSAKAEGLLLFFNEQESLRNFGNSSGDPGDEADFVALDDAFVFRLGLNYRFLPFGTTPYGSGYTAARGLAAEDEEAGGGAEEKGKGGGGASEEGPLSAWSLSGVINRAMLVWDDGSQTAVNSIDNPQDSSNIELLGEWELDNGWSLSANMVFDTYFASGDAVSQTDWDGNGLTIEMPYLLAEIGHDSFGKFIGGLSDSASDEIDNINLAGSDAIADASFDNFANNFFLRAEGINGTRGLATGEPNSCCTEIRWGDVLDAKFSGESGEFITYVSPTWNGFELSSSVGQPQVVALVNNGNFEISGREGGVFADAALRYNKTWNDFRIAAGIGGWSDTTEEKAAKEPTEDLGVGLSFAVRHEPTGLNIAVNYARRTHTDDCAEPGEISGDCRGPEEFLYTKGGMVRDLISWGPTAVYGEFFKGWKEWNDSDPDLVASLWTGPEDEIPTLELKSSNSTGWGFGALQRISRINTEMYVGVRHYNVDFDLLGEDGSVPAREFEDFLSVVAGLTIHWGGKHPYDPDEPRLPNQGEGFQE